MKAAAIFKKKLIATPVQALSKSNGQYTIDTDTCNTQEGAFFYRSKKKTFRNLSVTGHCYSVTRTIGTSQPQKECLAVVWAVLMLRPYLEGSRFVVRADRQALQWELHLKDST